MAHKIRIFDRHWHLPQSKAVRIAIGILLVIAGLVGFLPVLGFWMIPLGLLVLSIDLPIVRRWRRQLTVWWHRRKGEEGEEDEAPGTNGTAARATAKKDASGGHGRH
jgi:purine-cytosine permease-like protein